jgi:2-polyprenyl-6-hydroxyphenyl methylase/3-demethylubiquinone-9 3-methyltransferase
MISRSWRLHAKSTLGGGALQNSLPAGAAFHEGLAAGWSAGYESGSFRSRLACFRSILRRNVSAGQTWLDLGCGSGVLTAEMLECGAAVVAVDGSPAMLERARVAVAARAGMQLRWLQSDVQALPLPDSTFDGILCSSVVEYVEQPHAVLQEAARTLRPGGQLVLSLPPRSSAIRTAQKMTRRLAGVFGREAFGYLSLSRFEIDPVQLKEWFGNAGFFVERVTKFDPFLPRAALTMLHPALLVVEAHKRDF